MVFDLLILGGGPAGLTAGLYAARVKLNTLLLEANLMGGRAALTDLIENYPGFPEGIAGAELMQRFTDQALRFGLRWQLAQVTDVELGGEIKRVTTSAGVYEARRVVIATGTERRKLGIAGEEELTGRGISYCATCDGAFFGGKKVAVVGGGDAALKEALFLTKFAREVVVIHRREEFRAGRSLQERARADKKIRFLLGRVPEAVVGESFVRGLTLRNVRTGKQEKEEVEGIFVAIGAVPSTAFLKGKLALDKEGYILTNESCEALLPGVFAAGDVRAKALRQVATAVGDGAVAAAAVERSL